MKLHKYQERALTFALEHEAVALFIDLGMGKTAITLKLIEHTGQKAFVFGPLRTIYSSWPDEIEKWTPQLSYYILHGPDKSLSAAMKADIILMNYEGLSWLSKQRYSWTRRTVVFDESSMVKSHSTQRFKLLNKMRPMWNNYRILLSATPAPNSLQELWAQFALLLKHNPLGKNISEFRRRYCTSFSYPGMSFTQYKVDPRFTQEIYDAVAPRTFRLAARDYLDMPPITYNSISCELTTSLARKYRELEETFFLELEEGEVEAVNAATLSMKLRQFIQGGLYDEDKIWRQLHDIKLRALKELVETSAGQPILCAIQFKGERAMVEKAFPNVPVIAGGTTARQASEYIKKWNSGQIPLLLCHPASLSHGVNLQSGGHLLLWYGLTWSLEQYLQLNGRLYRQGQQNHVVIHHLIMKDTIDEAVMKALARKEQGQSSLLSYLKSWHKSLSS